MLTQEEKQFSEILETLGETLDTESQYNAAVSSYGASWRMALAKPSLITLKVHHISSLLVQGSFMLGTMIKTCL